MFCTGCGKENQGNSKFCVYCGKPFGQNQMPAQGQPQSVPGQVQQPAQKVIIPTGMPGGTAAPMNGYPGPTYAAPQTQKKSSPAVIILIIVGCILGLAVLAGAVLLFLNKKDNDSEKQDTTTVTETESGRDTGDEGTAGQTSDVSDSGDEVTEGSTEEGITEEAPENDLASEARSAMENHVRDSVSCFGDTNLVWATKGFESYSVGDPDFSNFANKVAGSKIADFDEDGMPELLYVFVNARGGLSLIVDEYENGEIVMGGSNGMEIEIAEIPGYMQGVLSVFTIGNTIYVEQSEVAHMFADGLLLGLDEFTYSNNQLVAGKSAGYGGSDLEYSQQFMDSLSAMGAVNASWNDLTYQNTRPHEYMNGVEGICEFYGRNYVDDNTLWNWQGSNSYEPLAVTEVTVRNLTSGPVVISGGNDMAVSGSNSDFVFPDSDSRFLSESELYILDKETSRIAINELYARHGYVFTTDEMKNYFNSFEWYRNTTKNPNFDANRDFNRYEQANKELLIKYAEDRGWR